MDKKLIEKIEQVANRRAFLRKLTIFAGALVAGIAGASKSAYACFNCCSLCKDPSTCSFTGCACSWAWVCADNINCFKWRCLECFVTPPCSGSTCNGVKCSKIEYAGKITGCVPK